MKSAIFGFDILILPFNVLFQLSALFEVLGIIFCILVNAFQKSI
jgi:hypothetical protein